MDAERLLDSKYIKTDLERTFDAVVNSCGNVCIEIIEIPYKDQAGGTAYLGGDGTKIVITTVPQLSLAWQNAIGLFRDPWFNVPEIRQYIKKNDLLKFLIEDDCTVKQEIWEKFRDKLISIAYNNIMNEVAKLIGDEIRKTKQENKKTSKIKVTKKPVHKNKPLVGGIGITIAALILQYVNANFSGTFALIVSGIITMALSAIEHKNLYEVREEIASEEKYLQQL